MHDKKIINEFIEKADDLRKRYDKLKYSLHVRSAETEQWHIDRARLNSIAFRSDLRELDEMIKLKREFDDYCQVSHWGIL